MSDVIDTRELAEELRELEFLAEESEPGLDEEDTEKLKQLRELADEITDFYNGETLIAEGYFVQYAKELAQDIGAVNDSHGWPLDCIDWDKAADQLLQDYTTVEYDGDTYYVRSC